MAKLGYGEGSISQRADGRWMARFRVDGKVKTLYAATEAKAKTALRKALGKKDEGLLVAGPNQTVDKYLHRWLEDCARQSVRPRTYECYVLAAHRLVPYIGKTRLQALTPAHVQKAYAALLDKGLSRRTVQLTHAVLHHALRQALQWGQIARNPTDAVSAPRPTRKEMQVLSQEQVETLFAANREDRLYALWVTLATAGLRIGEALGLRWSDVDFTSRQVAIQRALQHRAPTGYQFVEPKTARSRRTVVFPASTIQALQEHRRRQVAERLQVGSIWENGDLVFCNEIGQPLNASSTVTGAFQRALVRAGLPRIRIHDMRHTAATLLLSQGCHPKYVQDLLGHSTITLTLDTYSHVVPALHGEAADKMERLFAGKI